MKTIIEPHRVKMVEPIRLTDRREREDLIAAAVNDAVHRVETVSQEHMSKLTSGLNLPPGVKLPF